MSRRIRLPAVTAPRVVVTLLLLAGLGAGAGFALGRAGDQTWQAQRHALIRVWSIDSLVLSGQTADVTANNLADASTVATSTDVLAKAAAGLDDGVGVTALADAVTATASPDSDFVQISATGPSAAEADRRVQAVAAAFVTVVRTKVLASATQIALLTAGGAGNSAARAEIQVRAQAVAALDPVQVYRTGSPERDGTGPTTAGAVGLVVGLALGALLIVMLTFAAPRLRRPEDVADALGLPALWWTGPDAPAGADDGIRGDLVRAASHGAVAVCPARPEDGPAAARFGHWLAEALEARVTGPVGSPQPQRSPYSGVVNIASPVDTLARSRPPADAIDTAVLVTSAGSNTELVERAADLLGQWRRMDAVILIP